MPPFSHPAHQEIGPALEALENQLRVAVTERYMKVGQQIPVLITDTITRVSQAIATLRAWQPSEGSLLADPMHRRELASDIQRLTASLAARPQQMEAHLAELDRIFDTMAYFFEEG